MEEARAQGRRLAREALARGDTVGWFEELYAGAGGDEASIQWADMAPNPHLVGWLDRRAGRHRGNRALVVGCGLGDDAEEVARRSFDVVAFDVAPTAVAWCRRRFPHSPVEYTVADLLAPPPTWAHAFDLVVEVYTLQVLPPHARLTAMEHLADLVSPGGTLLVVCRGRESREDAGQMPWPLTRAELGRIEHRGLRCMQFEDFDDEGTRRFLAEYGKASPDARP